MDTIVLGPRLAALARFCAGGGRLADVGTDHGYLPIYLLETGKLRSAVATDIHKKPLQNAMENARAHGVEKNISFVLTDGLRGVDLQGIDVIAIAGMGGETMISILDAVPEQALRGIRLALQPMTKTVELLRWLYSRGFCVEDECLVKESGMLYRVFSVCSGSWETPEEADLLAGPLLSRNHDPLLNEYIEKLCAQIARKREGMAKSENEEVRREAERLGALMQALERKKEEESHG